MNKMPLANGEAERAPLTKGRSFLLLATVILLVEVIPLAYNFVTPALPEIAGHFQTTAVGWVITLVTLVLAATTPIMGKLGDIYGKKLVMLSASAVFAVGCLIAAVAPNFELFLVGRGLQGAGMGILVLAYGLIRDVLPRELVPVAVGFIATGMGASTILGPVIGGYLIDHFGYASVFWAQLAHVTVAGVLVALLVPESTLRTKSRLDVVGALILAVGAFVLLFGIGKASTWGFADVRTLGTVLGGAAILAAWLLYERRPAEPLVDLELLLHRPVAKTLTASALVQFVLISHSMLIPMFVMTDRSLDLGYGFGRTALGVALFTIPTGIASMIAGPVGGYLSRRTGPALVLVAGAGALAVGSAMLAFMHDTTGQLIAGQIVMGLGLGAASSALPNLIMGTVPATSQGIAGGMLNLFGSMGSAIGSQLAVAILTVPGVLVAASKMPMYQETGYVYAFGALAVAGALAAVVGLSLHTNRIQSAPGSSALVDEPAQSVAIGH
ncbi:MFS transporter [Rhodococcus tukisamuensis]|uniref:Major Facilitator Superfamily protein n=1 Tax=Rhodococcus tukisamuensis TaxID=168276 RepID=A0A1G7DRX0_9NOCA|nr:MFS transporter [Rhodococcus tukisamuensis]SDE54231.1 Major Facilitator Superfamily protein [Rhodococcus tukisamuensis]